VTRLTLGTQINAPYLFSTAWSFVRPLLDEVTVSKISILGSNYRSVLLEQIPAENLPTYLGGTCQCPGGCSMRYARVGRNKGKQRHADERLRYSNAGPWKDVAEGRLKLDDDETVEAARKAEGDVVQRNE
jgi:hypothetical protein